MQEKARIVEIGAQSVTVIPVDIEACIGCSNSECKDNGHIFTVVNRRRHDIKVGDTVCIKSPMRNQIGQGIIAIGIPVALAAGVFILMPSFVPGVGEGGQVGASLGALLIGSLVTYFAGKRTESDMPEITEVL